MSGSNHGTRAAPTPRPHDAATRHAFPPRRYALLFATVLGLPLLLLFVGPVAPQNGIAWDLLMTTGFAGAALMIVLPLVSPRLWLRFGGDPRALRTILNLHADLSYVAVALVLVHTVGLVLVDTTLIEYLKLSAPWSMLAALVSVLLLVVLLISSWYRIALGMRYRSWRLWHVGLSLAAVSLMAFHVIDAGYFVNSPLKASIFVLLVAAPVFMSLADGALARGHARTDALHATDPRPLACGVPATRLSSTRLAGLLGVLLVVATIIVVIPKPGSRAESEAAACVQAPCG